jgi:hypothetical protein
MKEIIARISLKGDDIELIDENSIIISPEPLTAQDAAYLSRGLMSCAAALFAPNKPNPKSIIGYTEFPVLEWKTMTSALSGNLVLILSIPPGIELTFELTAKGAKEMGVALVFAGESQQTTVVRSGSGMVH